MDDQQPDFNECDSNFGLQQHQHEDKQRAPERTTGTWCHGCGALLWQNCVPVCVLGQHTFLCIYSKRPGDNRLCILFHIPFKICHSLENVKTWTFYLVTTLWASIFLRNEEKSRVLTLPLGKQRFCVASAHILKWFLHVVTVPALPSVSHRLI